MQTNKPAAAGKVRHLKIYTRYGAAVWKALPETFPEIRLKGKWLKRIGFEEGKGIEVREEENKITIRVI